MELAVRLMRPLWYLTSFGEILLLFRLIYLGVHKRYPALTLFLATDVLIAAVGLRFGTASRTYYWTFFVSGNLAGSAILIWMCREMFRELYCYHSGLRGLTKFTLRRSIMIGASAALLIAPPVGLLHWGDPQFQCWEFPFFELHRCLELGVALFAITMWLRLQALPLDIPSNVKTYAWAACPYFACCSSIETAVLAMHSQRATIIWSDVLLVASLAFYVVLAWRIERPREIRAVQFLLVDPKEFAWLSSISGLFMRVNEAQRRGYESTLRRYPFFVLLFITFCYSAWKLCARGCYIVLGLLQRE